MSRHVDVMMQARDRMCEMSREDYDDYMFRRKRGRSRSRSYNVVDERGENGWELDGGGSSGRVRSRSPQRLYDEGKGLVRGNVLDFELSNSHSFRGRNPSHPFQSVEAYEPASPVRSPCSIDIPKYGYPTSQAGLNEYITGNRNNMVVSDDIDVVRESIEDSRIVRPHQGFLPVSSYREISRHFHPGSSNRTAGKRDQHGSYLSMERELSIGAYNGDSHLPCSRDTSYPLCSKSQNNLYVSTSHAFRDGGRISSQRQDIPLPRTISDDLCGNKSLVSERFVFDGVKGKTTHYSTLGHHNGATSSSHQLKSSHDSTQHLNYHYPSVSRENGDLGHLSDRECRNACARYSQTHVEGAPAIGREAKGFFPDEGYGTLCQDTRKEWYNAHVSSGIINENEDTCISDCSFKDSHFSHRLSHDRDIHSDPHSCLSIRESLLHCGTDQDNEDPHFITPSHGDHVFMAAGTCVDIYHNQVEKTSYANSRADLIYNADETHDGLSESRFWSSSTHNKQDGEQFYYTSRTISSTEPKDNYVDSGMYYPQSSSDLKQNGDHFDLPPPKKEICNERFRYRDSEMGSTSSKYGLVYDVKATSEYGMPEGRTRTGANRQRRSDEGPEVCGATSGVLETNPVRYKRYHKLNSGYRASNERCSASLSWYLPDRGEVLSEDEMTLGADHHPQRTGSRSIFDRLGSPQGSIDRIPRKHGQGYSNSQKHEHKTIKDHRKSNHLALRGFPHSSRGSSCCKQSSSSNTNTDKPAMDTDTLKDVDLPFNPASHNNNRDCKQSIQNAFLIISQKINENPATRMRYKGQGKAGTLFCIVCKRSNSKEFRVARNLAAHSLTCQKAELRAQHLGLFKAICVTMGWDSDIDTDQQSGIWTPKILSEEKALAQKEDLICWPPVFVVHNFSLLGKNQTEHKVLTAEELEAFFRSKGFISGRVKVCLGHSTNSHIMVIRFLGTFSGFKDAEKVHEYFAERKRGRLEFWKLADSNGKGSKPYETGLYSDDTEMPDLYGYMGIAEDWGKLDNESKKRCTVKSKQEILDFSAEPILP